MNDDIISVTEEGVRSHFETFGPLCAFELKKRPDGSSRGFGFLRYKELGDQVSWSDGISTRSLVKRLTWLTISIHYLSVPSLQ